MGVIAFIIFIALIIVTFQALEFEQQAEAYRKSAEYWMKKADEEKRNRII